MITCNDEVLIVDDYTIKRKYNGLDTLEFNISENSSQFRYMVNRQQLKCDNRLWLISLVRAGGKGSASVTADLDLDDWKTDLVAGSNIGYRTADEYFQMMHPVGWTVVPSGSTAKAISAPGYKTQFEIMKAYQEAFNISLHFDTLRKVLTVIAPESYQSDNKYVIEGLNANKIACNEKTSTFCTRLYPLGKDNLSIAPVNPTGESYIENHTYSDATISMIWNATDYDDPTELYNAAIAYLDRVCQPEIEYNIDMYDLAKMSSEYSWLNIGLLSIVSVKDNRRKRDLLMQVTEYEEHPLNPAKNKIKLSTRLKTTNGAIQDLNEKIKNVASGVGCGGSQTQYRIYKVERINDIQLIIHAVNTSNKDDKVANVWDIVRDDETGNTKYVNLTSGETIDFIGWEDE